MIENENNNYMKVAERLYYEINPNTKMDVPSSAYEMAERWHKEYLITQPNISFYQWCKENKQPKITPKN